ncbi:hypothetical protein DsansV1_C37g0232851 [Dioscorea sansibarensis]
MVLVSLGVYKRLIIVCKRQSVGRFNWRPSSLKLSIKVLSSCKYVNIYFYLILCCISFFLPSSFAKQYYLWVLSANSSNTPISRR